MKKQAIETLIEQLESLKQNITTNDVNEQQATLLASLKFVAEYIKHMHHNNKCAEVQIAHTLIDALIDVNTQEMNFPEWITFSTYLHDLGNKISKDVLMQVNANIAEEMKNNE